MRSLHDVHRKNLAWLTCMVFLAAACASSPVFATDDPDRSPYSAMASSPEVGLEYVGGGLWDFYQTLDVSGNYAFLGTGFGVEIYDISEPAAFTVVGRVHTDLGEVRAIEVAGTRLLFVTSNRLHVVDVTDPHAPVAQGLCKLGFYHGTISAIAVRDDVAYVADYGNGLAVVDLTDPWAPQLLHSLLLENRPRAVDVSGNFMVVTSFDGLRVFSLSAPLHPSFLGYSPFQFDGTNDVVTASNYAYVALDVFGLQAYDFSQPASPDVVGLFDDDFSPHRSHLLGTTLYVAEGYEGISIHDLSDPELPVELGHLTLQGYTANIRVAGTTALAINNELGLQRIDVSDASLPVPGVRLPRMSASSDVVVQGEYAYVASDGLSVISLANPALPKVLSRLPLHTWGNGLAVQGDLVFAHDVDEVPGIRIVSVADPEHPVPLGFYPVYVEPQAVWADGDLLYIAADNLRIANVSNPQAPQSVSGKSTPGVATDVWVVQPYAYVADGDAGLSIIDVSDPYHMSIVGTFDSPGSATGVCVQGDRVYLADGSAGLHILDVSNPQAPVLLGSHETPGNARRVNLWGDYALVSDESGGLRVINVANPHTPYLYTAAVFDTRSLVRDVKVDGDRLVVAGGGELLVLSLEAFSGDYLLGDVNADAAVTSSDVIHLVNFVFKGGGPPEPTYRAGDLDCNGPINTADLIQLVNHVFKGGTAPDCT